jgi:hypothetical protein
VPFPERTLGYFTMLQKAYLETLYFIMNSEKEEQKKEQITICSFIVF